eukprot:gene6041-4336_t
MRCHWFYHVTIFVVGMLPCLFAALAPAQYEALQDLYISTGGSNWRWFENGAQWDFSSGSDPCEDSWEGIVCVGKNVVSITLNFCHLVGSIPPSIGNFSFLDQLSFEYNHLTGSLPSTVGKLRLMTGLYLNDNFLSGQIPPTIGNLANLIQLNFDFNRFSGSIPSEVGNMANLVGLGVNNNHLTGTIPTTIGQLSNIAGIRVHNNKLIGTIPDNLQNCSAVIDFGMFTNFLTGTIPTNINHLSKMSFIQLNNNMLSGVIPSGISQLSALTVFAVNDNALTGPISQLFNARSQTQLNTIQLSNNQLTGTLQSDLFHLPALVNVAAVSNCLHGSIPASVCAAQQLVTLALDGLRAATSCQIPLLSLGISKSYIVNSPVTGTIPACLFQMPRLKTLHLSGNGFVGRLDASNISDSLIDLSLSHNSLTGSIPLAIQSKHWASLDLSFNRLGGTLSPEFANRYPVSRIAYNRSVDIVYNTSISLQNNRISGRLPRPIIVAPSVSVLRGNLFTCDWDRSDLPPADDNAANYACGSQALNVAYIGWVVLIGLAIATVVLAARYALTPCGSWAFFQWLSETWRVWLLWYTLFDSDTEVQLAVPALCRVLDLCRQIVRICSILGGCIVCLCLPLYMTLSIFYRTHAEEYGWTASAAFQEGGVATGLKLAIFVLLTAFVMYLMQTVVLGRHVMSSHDDAGKTATAASSSARRMWHHRTALAVFVLVNTIVVVGVNIAFVVIALRENSTTVALSQIALALFKLVWNNFSTSGKLLLWFRRCMLRWLHPQSSETVAEASSIHDEEDAHERSVMQFTLLCVAMFNTLTIPCLVAAVISPYCFYNVFNLAPTVTSVYVLQQCTDADGVVCLTYRPYPQKTSFSPPFVYSYQCSSSLITYYTPTFVYMCVMSTVGTPLLQWCALYVHLHVRNANAQWAVSPILPKLLLPLTVSPHSTTEHQLNPILQGRDAVADEGAVVERDAHTTATAECVQQRVDPHRLLRSLMVYLGLLLTFGLVYPPLAFPSSMHCLRPEGKGDKASSAFSIAISGIADQCHL